MLHNTCFVLVKLIPIIQKGNCCTRTISKKHKRVYLFFVFLKGFFIKVIYKQKLHIFSLGLKYCTDSPYSMDDWDDLNLGFVLSHICFVIFYFVYSAYVHIFSGPRIFDLQGIVPKTSQYHYMYSSSTWLVSLKPKNWHKCNH